MPRGWQGWVCRGRRELSGRRAGGEERERAASLVPWARRDRKGEWGRKDRVVTLGLPVLREGWGNKVLWARRAWGCLVRLDRKGERGPLVLKDEGEKRGLVAYAVARVTRVPRVSEGMKAEENSACQGRRGRWARRGLWGFPECPDEGILDNGDQRDLWASRARRGYRGYPEAQERRVLLALPASTVTRASLGHLVQWECQGLVENRGAPACRVPLENRARIFTLPFRLLLHLERRLRTRGSVVEMKFTLLFLLLLLLERRLRTRGSVVEMRCNRSQRRRSRKGIKRERLILEREAARESSWIPRRTLRASRA